MAWREIKTENVISRQDQSTYDQIYTYESPTNISFKENIHLQKNKLSESSFKTLYTEMSGTMIGSFYIQLIRITNLWGRYCYPSFTKVLIDLGRLNNLSFIMWDTSNRIKTSGLAEFKPHIFPFKIKDI